MSPMPLQVYQVGMHIFSVTDTSSLEHESPAQAIDIPQQESDEEEEEEELDPDSIYCPEDEGMQHPKI